MELPPLGVDEKNPILKKSRAATGIHELDIILEGGYANPGIVMVLGPTGMEKTAFAFHFAIAGIAKKEKVFYITADSSPDEIINKASSLGMELKDGGELKFIDCYTATLGKQEQSSKHIVVPGPSALNDLSIAINEAIKQSAGTRMRIVFHSLSSFMLYNPKESLTKFLQVAGGRLKSSGATVLVLVEEGMHEKQLLSTIEHMMDERFIIHDKGGSFELEIPDIPAAVPIKIGPGGINIG